MGFLDWYERDRKLTDYAPGEVKREEDRLRIRENQSLARLEKLEEERDAIFRRGAQPGAGTRRPILARLFADRQRECEALQEELARLSKEALVVAAIRFRIERKIEGDSSALRKVEAPAVDGLTEAWADGETDEVAFGALVKEALGKVKSSKGDPLKGLGRRAREVMGVWKLLDQGELTDLDAGLLSITGGLPAEEDE